MSQKIPRRSFLATTAGALAFPNFPFSEVEPPSMLDHILLGCNDLDHGVAFVEEHTGIRAAFGGVHPGRGTCNALLALGERRYLEIIAPDPAQDKVPDFAAPLLQKLKSLSTPRLVGWADHPGSIEALAARLKAAGIAFDGPRDGSRARPDGRLLKWKTLNLADDRNGHGAGEDTHGTHEFYVERARITRRLIAEQDFAGVVIEGDWSEAAGLRALLTEPDYHAGAGATLEFFSDLQAFGHHQIDQVADTAGVSPLIVVPGDYFHAVSAYHQG